MAEENRFQFFKHWSSAGLPSFAAIILPWQEKLTSMGLISDFFQPSVNIAASILGPLACFVTHVVLHKSPREWATNWFIFSTIIFVICLATCLLLQLTVGTVFFPSESLQYPIWFVEIFAYLATFSAFGIAMVSGGLSLTATEPEKTESSVDAHKEFPAFDQREDAKRMLPDIHG